jgi:phenylpyruvate tautomerase PptA (4-oxalocrotonate tautomerase family)
MPVLEIYTNKTISNKKEIAVKASKLMAELLGKPESVSSPLSGGGNLTYAGS